MARISLQATTTVTTEIKLEPKIRQMVVQRCEEHAGLGRVISESKGRQKRIQSEVQELFKKGKQGKALASGTKLADHSLKMVFGSRKKFDQIGFMKKHGLSQADFDEFTETLDNSPYLRISSGREKGDADGE